MVEKGTPIGNMAVGLTLDDTQFGNTLDQINKRVKIAESALKANLKSVGDAGKGYDGLSVKAKSLENVLSAQGKKVQELTKRYEEEVKANGEASDGAKNLAVQINNAQAKLSGYEGQLKTTKKELAYAEQGMNELTQEMKDNERETNKNTKTLKAAGDETGAFETQQKGLTRQLDLTERAVDGQRKVVSQLTKEFGENDDSTKKAVRALNSLESQAKVTNSQLSSLNSTGKSFDVTSNIDNNTRSFKGMFSGISGIKTALLGGFVTAGIFAVGKAFDVVTGSIGAAVERVDKIDVATKSLEQLTGSAKVAGEVMSDVSEVIKGTPIAMDQMTDATKGLVASGMEADKVKDVLKAITDSAYGVGNGAESIDQISGAFKAMQSSGVLSLEDLNRLMDANVPALKILANQYGVSVADMKKNISTGTMDSAEAIDLLVEGIQKGTDGSAGATTALAGQAKTAGDSISGSFANMKSAINRSIANIITPFKGIMIKSMTVGGQVIEKTFGGIGTNIQWLMDRMKSVGNPFKGLSGGISIFKTIVDKNMPMIKQVIGNALNNFKVIIATLKPFIEPIINQIVGIFKKMFTTLKIFWQENGPMIMAAVLNIVNFIQKTVAFLLPVLKPIFAVLLFLIKDVLGTVGRIISGSLNIFMGVLKVFAGLFTGNFSKMWEGIKQIFSGAFTVIWNLLNLMFIGKILKGFKLLGAGVKTVTSGMWTTVKTLFTKGVSSAWGSIKSFPGNVITLFKNMGTGVGKWITNMIDSVKSMPGKMADGFKRGAGAMKNAFTSVFAAVAKAVAKPINGIIDGINWVLKKVGVSKGTLIGNWSVPAYANGTDGHPGGLAMVNDASGSNYREAVQLPGGETFVPKGRNQLLNLPKGSKVLNGNMTKQMFPHYKNGIGDFFSGIKDKALDVWEYAKEPMKLVKATISKFTSGMFGDMMDLPKQIALGAKDKVLGGMGNWIKGIFEESGGDEPKGSGVTRWTGTVKRALSMNGLPTDKPYVNAWLRQIQSESGGNPKAIQGDIGDVNNESGDIAKGLVQVIGETFKAYKFPGHGNRLNGLDSLLSGINYAKSTYGATGMLNVIGKGHGYANGGLITKHQIAEIGEGNQPEMIIPLSLSKRSRAVQLLNQTMNLMGVKESGKGNVNIVGGSDTSALESKMDTIIAYLKLISSKDTNVNVDLGNVESYVSKQQADKYRKLDYAQGGAV
ncbi:tape measure protein [Brochothrix campestris]|uniref:Tail length tape measure protein n=1 Tax=Brochothrix campestris FSL F6-1037 TaxID=1265861 RepID=W7CEP4_9LIST|nr:tape measure protein [Brochothrix campestris]EUJ34276.1 tail length tape measure protein [Brochothrix campestris FSL F6-1037]